VAKKKVFFHTQLKCRKIKKVLRAEVGKTGNLGNLAKKTDIKLMMMKMMCNIILRKKHPETFCSQFV
jgi:hypothetical protein